MKLDEVKSLASKYYAFILKYEKIIPVIEPILSSKLSQKDLEQYRYVYNRQKRNFQPWNYLESELSKETITDLFLEDSKEPLKFVIAEDGLCEQLYTFGYIELKEYYKTQNISKDSEELSEEMKSYIFSNSLNKNIFSKELIDIFKLYRELKILSSKLYDLYQNLKSKRIMSHAQAKGLANIYYNFISQYDKEKQDYNSDIEAKSTNFTPEQKEFILKLNENLNLQYEPWKILPKGKEIEILTEIFEFNLEMSYIYFNIYQKISDEYIFQGVEELKNYYKENNITKSEEELFEEMVNYENKGQINTTIFSNEVIKNFNNMMKLKPIYEVFEEIRKKNLQKQNEIELEK